MFKPGDQVVRNNWRDYSGCPTVCVVGWCDGEKFGLYADGALPHRKCEEFELVTVAMNEEFNRRADSKIRPYLYCYKGEANAPVNS